MVSLARLLNATVAALAATVMFSLPATAQTAKLDELFEKLKSPEGTDYAAVEREIWTEFGKSGSASIDLLLQRGRDAMEREDYATAVDFLTALTDHAPEFAEGWNARATAFFNLGQYSLSLGDIQRTLALNPRHFGAMGGLAMIFEEIGRPEDALKVWREVEKISPNRHGLQGTIARLERAVGGQNI